MAEERPCPEGQRCQEELRCANNCGFFGSSATLNLCSKCYGDHLKAQDALHAIEKSILASSSSSSTPFCSSSPPAAAAVAVPESTIGAAAEAEGPRRCSACRKKVGLIGIKCRCGSTYCVAHRYPEQHGCCFDFKSVGRDAIARCNPLIKAEKLDKI